MPSRRPAACAVPHAPSILGVAAYPALCPCCPCLQCVSWGRARQPPGQTLLLALAQVARLRLASELMRRAAAAAPDPRSGLQSRVFQPALERHPRGRRTPLHSTLYSTVFRRTPLSSHPSYSRKRTTQGRDIAQRQSRNTMVT